ncbi:putative amidoligase domain-containing protein [Paenibacillus gansuensis]|uniref:PhiEco32-like amidoligase-type 2 protein n=1 Tax=Paenibacillus gansuensis TaxID=306542 RepID=A0ABW5PCD5_9BACL
MAALVMGLNGVELLAAHGFVTAWEVPGQARNGIAKSYLVQVDQMEAAALLELVSGPFGVREQERAINLSSTLHKRLCREAVRALYVLGADGGRARLKIDDAGRIVVMGVELAADGVLPEAGTHARETAILIGADPEFVLRHRGSGEIADASRFLSRRGKAGSDAVVVNGEVRYLLAELRPEPAAEPRALVRRLRSAMRAAARAIRDPELEWLAGGMPVQGYALGGHVHLSGVPLCGALVRALDAYLALPLVLAEDASTGRRRIRYGKLGDVRRQPHGGFEYRTPPSWLVSPGLALGVLSMAAFLARHYRELDCSVLENLNVINAYYAGDKETLLPAVTQLYAVLAKHPGYEAYGSELETYWKQLLQMNGWNEKQDFRRSWKIPPFD